MYKERITAKWLQRFVLHVRERIKFICPLLNKRWISPIAISIGESAEVSYRLGAGYKITLIDTCAENNYGPAVDNARLVVSRQ